MEEKREIIVNYNDEPKTSEGEKPILRLLPDFTYAARVSMPASRNEDNGILVTKEEIRAMIRALQKVQ